MEKCSGDRGQQHGSFFPQVVAHVFGIDPELGRLVKKKTFVNENKRLVTRS